MKRIAMVAGLAVAGCATAANLREDAPFIQTATMKPTDNILECMAGQWSARAGTNVSVAPGSITLSYLYFSSPVTMATLAVQDRGADRLVSVHARGVDQTDRLRREVAACV